MPNAENLSNIEKIQRGVKETERLLGQKKYNTSMIRARQTLEQMVRLMGERACIVGNDLAESIDQLYHGRWISKTSCEHYHKIRMMGNRAVHEEHEDAFDANMVSNLLSREVYTFLNDYNSNHRQKKTPSANANRSSQNRGRKRTRQKRNGLSIPDFLKILLPVLCILILVLIIWLKPNKEKPVETTEAPTTEVTTLAPTTAPPETQPATTTAATPVYKTNDTLNIRKDPSTNSAKIGVLSKGTSIDYIRKYDDFWSVINFNGQEGYVATQYLTTE